MVVCKFPEPCWYRQHIQGSPKTFQAPIWQPNLLQIKPGETFDTESAIGSGLVRAGFAILAVPDPLPVVDELVGAGLITLGLVLIYLE